jgi:hypothetical protein
MTKHVMELWESTPIRGVPSADAALLQVNIRDLIGIGLAVTCRPLPYQRANGWLARQNQEHRGAVEGCSKLSSRESTDGVEGGCVDSSNRL